MKVRQIFITLFLICTVLWTWTSIIAQDQEIQKTQDQEMQKAMEFFSTAGIPGDKWIEGETMVPHVAAASHFTSTMLYYPGTEELQPDEVRVILWGRRIILISHNQE